MKKYSKKFLVPVLSVFAIGLSVGVGFAAWTIVGQNATQTVNNNTITAEGISDKRVTLTAKEGATQGISFSSKADESITNPWLARDSKSEEKLDFSFAFTLSSKDGTTKLSELVSDIEYTITVNDNTSKGWNSAVSAGYVSNSLSFSSPSVTTSTLGTKNTFAATSLTGTSQEISISGSFAWGTHFDSKNPYAYYNSKEANATLDSSSTTYADDASDSLSNLEKDLQGVTFTLTVSATPRAA